LPRVTKALVIANPSAGSAKGAEQAYALAQQFGWTWHWTESGGEATRLAASACAQGYERVIAAGGDGTVHLVVQGLMSTEQRPVLGILPLGTGNDLARTLGFSLRSEEALLEISESREVRRIDVARATIDGKVSYVINSSAGGLSGEVDRVVSEEDKERWGPFAYVRGALDVLGDPPMHEVTIAIDGAEVARLRSICVVVANGKTVGGGLRVTPAADPEDGRFDILAVDSAPVVALATLAPLLKTGGIASHPLAHHYSGSSIDLRFEPAMALNVDGELIGDVHSARYEVLAGAIPVVVGPGYRRAEG
jgi:diacylglycerol kinase (ATP)